jgi:cobalt-zinc-cadmium efflux system membrane fusion protein
MSRSIARDAAVLVVGGLIGAGGLYAAQQGPSAVAAHALALYSGLMGGDGHAHAEAPKALAAADGHKEGDGHAHGKDDAHSKDDGHGHGKDDGHDHGKDDGHGHDKPKPKPEADAGAPMQLAAADDHKEGDGHAHGKDDAHSKDDGHRHGRDDAHSKEDGHVHGSGKDDGHGHGADDGHGHDRPKPKVDARGDASLKVAAVEAKDDGHGHGAGKEDDGHGHGAELPKGVVELGDAKARAAGIALAKAGASTLREELRLNGIVQANQEAVVQVTPRFPGVVRTLAKRLGDEVKKGELLAVVESNQSLTTYELKAPMAGVVTERQASLGEYVSEQKPAFVITDLSTLWVDFSVYRRDLAKVAVGETVRIDPEDGGEPIEAKISYLSPIGAADTQSAVARSVIPNDGRFRPGLFATGAVATAEQSVPLAVSLDAVQSLEGRDVVFVREGGRFVARDVTLGRRDGRSVEIVTGLKGGEAYASRNSFVVKAELAKGSASHEH